MLNKANNQCFVLNPTVATTSFVEMDSAQEADPTVKV